MPGIVGGFRSSLLGSFVSFGLEDDVEIDVVDEAGAVEGVDFGGVLFDVVVVGVSVEGGLGTEALARDEHALLVDS